MKNILLVLIAVSAAAGGPLRLGRGAVSITPPGNYPMGGGYSLEFSHGVEDELYAKALVLEQDGVRAALVSCDIVGLPERFVKAARELIARETGMPRENVMISATHTHAGPEMIDLLLEQAKGNVLEMVKRYQAELPERIAQAVRIAVSDMQPVTVRAGTGSEPSLAFNRRFVMKDGTVQFNPGKLNPDIVRPAGPIDPTVAMVLFENAKGEPAALDFNFPMHVAIGGPKFSADYPGMVSRVVAGTFGPDVLTVFTSGAAGNINHWDVRKKDQQTGPREVTRVGTILAAEILKRLPELKPVSGAPLRVAREHLQLPLAAPKPGEMGPARKIMAAAAAGKEIPFLEVVHAFQVAGAADYEKTVPAEVQVISLGDQVAWVGLPGEIFVELGMAIKQASPFPVTIVSELTNDDIKNSYVPNHKAYREGGYEVITAICGEGAGEMLVDSATRLLLRAHDGLPGTRYQSPPELRPEKYQ